MTRSVLLGRIVDLWRYPVKSMTGEQLTACEVTERGILGDRGYALIDEASNLVGSAKNPRAWPDLLAYRAEYVEPPRSGVPLPAVRITLPDGRTVTSGDGDDVALTKAFGRPVTLRTRPPAHPTLEQLWPDLDGAGTESVTAEGIPAGSFFDLSLLNLLLTTTLDHLAGVYPDGRFDVRRFRPNLLATPSEPGANPEGEWVGCTLALGNEVRVRIDARCARCVMTSLGQADLPRDVGILRTVVRANAGYAGLNVSVVRPGVVRVGDEIVAV